MRKLHPALLLGFALVAGGCGGGGTDVLPTDAGVDVLPDVMTQPDLDAGPQPDQVSDLPVDTPPPDTAKGCVPPLGEGWDGCVPERLSETGLYSDLAQEALSEGVMPYVPAVELWSDGADKQRWAYLPPGTQIDTSDMDHWAFPVGTRFWKEFTRDGVRVETRFIGRFGEGPRDFIYAAYQWRPDGTDADLVVNGVENASETEHDIPSQRNCTQCHNPSPQKILGFSALQLSHEEPGWNLGALIDAGQLSDPPSARSFTVPGDDVTRTALAYLNANCGNCHNATSVPEGFDLTTSVLDVDPEDTGPYRTAVDQSTSFFSEVPFRIVSGDAKASAIVVRMGTRNMVGKNGKPVAMPPIGTEIVDDAGLAAVSEWINSLPSPK